MKHLISTTKVSSQILGIKNSLPRASAILLALTLLVILFNVATMMSETLNDKTAPKAVKGEMDLTRFSLADVSSIPLNGHWSFYWQQLLTPAQINAEKHQASYLDIPHSWSSSTIDSQSLPNYGYATYQINVTTKKYYSHLTLRIPNLGTAYRLFVDDQLLAEGGQVGMTAESSAPGYNPQMVLIEPKSEQFSITLQLSNFDYQSSGIRRPIRLGETQNIQQQQYQHILRSTFLIAIFLTVALLNLIQFTLRTADPLPVIIALTCLMLALRELAMSQMLHFTGLTQWSFNTSAKISYLTYYATTPLMVAYFHISFWQEYKKFVMWIFYLVCTTASLLVVFTTPKIFSQSLPFFQAFTILSMPFILWGLIQAVRNQRPSSRLLTLGTVFLFALVLNDILYNLGIIDTGLMVSFGLVAFIMCQNYLTYIRFIDAGRQNEMLSETLEEKNTELLEFSQSLEQKVELRTVELAKANEKLGKLAHQDMLTGLPNRRGMMGYLEESIVQHRQNNTPFCLLIIDFDKFKQLNDTLGHEVGDKVLAKGAELMREVLRIQDHVARWGGEEFLILLPGTPIKGAETLACKVKDNIKETLTKSIGAKVTVTIGIAAFEQTDTLASCLKRADTALYSGKNNGRDQVVLNQQAL